MTNVCVCQLNLLELRQVNLTTKVSYDDQPTLTEVTLVNLRIAKWYEEEYRLITMMSQSQDINLNKKVRIYHHGLHNQFRKRSPIVKLEPLQVLQRDINPVPKLWKIISLHTTPPCSPRLHPTGGTPGRGRALLHSQGQCDAPGTSK